MNKKIRTMQNIKKTKSRGVCTSKNNKSRSEQPIKNINYITKAYKKQKNVKREYILPQ